MSDVSSAVRSRPFFKRDPLTSIVFVILVFFLSQIAAGVLISIYPAVKNWTGDQASAWLESSVYAQFAYILIAEFFAVWMILKLLKRARVTRARIGLVKPAARDAGYALIGYGVYFVCYIVIILIASSMSSLIDVDQPQQIGFESAAGSSLILVFLSLAVLPPIAEEIMFRGFLFTSLRGKFRLRYTIILTSLLFGIAHLQFGSGAPLLWVAAIDTFILSCVLCYLRAKTGSLWASIILHALKNSVAFIALFHSKF